MEDLLYGSRVVDGILKKPGKKVLRRSPVLKVKVKVGWSFIEHYYRVSMVSPLEMYSKFVLPNFWSYTKMGHKMICDRQLF